MPTPRMERNPLLLAGTEIYRPLCRELRQFRLLTILPGQAPATIHCLLSVASLEHDIIPVYSTISYVWGDRDRRGSIVVNSATVNVPFNTMAALRRMRLRDHERIVWIDAVCINQIDLYERSAQVAMMAIIYGNGSQNLVFLGDDEHGVAEDAKDVLQASLERITMATASLSEKDLDDLKAGRPVVPWQRNTIFEGLDLTKYDSFYELAWFRRLWVLQEAVLAPRSICYWGTAEIMLSAVLIVSKVLSGWQRLYECTAKARLSIFAATEMHGLHARAAKRFAEGSPAFFLVALACRGFLTTEPRDRVFAALQLYLADSRKVYIPDLLQPDYAKPPMQIFCDATRYVLRHEKHAGGFMLGQISHRTVQDIECKYPSWTFMFDRGKDMDHDPMAFCSYRAGLRPGEDRWRWEPSLRNEPDRPEILKLLVARVDWTIWTTQVIAFNPSAESIRHVLAHISTSTTSDHERNAEVMLAGSTDGFRNTSHRLEGYRNFIRHISEHETLPEHSFILTENALGETRLASHFGRLFSHAAKNRRFFGTCTGYIGWGPKLMQESDVVVIVKGADAPYILRPVGVDYLFLGIAWVEGLMHGEIFDKGRVEWEWVDVR